MALLQSSSFGTSGVAAGSVSAAIGTCASGSALRVFVGVFGDNAATISVNLNSSVSPEISGARVVNGGGSYQSQQFVIRLPSALTTPTLNAILSTGTGHISVFYDEFAGPFDGTLSDQEVTTTTGTSTTPSIGPSATLSQTDCIALFGAYSGNSSATLTVAGSPTFTESSPEFINPDNEAIGGGYLYTSSTSAVTGAGTWSVSSNWQAHLLIIRLLMGTAIQQQPGSVSITDGDKAYLQVVSSAATWQWQDNRSGSFANCSDGTGATTANYITASLATADTGRQYRCVLDGSTNTNNATITVIAKRAGTLGQWDPELRIDGWF